MLGMPENKVAIIPLFDPDKSPGGIWIPEQAKERCDQGVVKYCGPKCEIVAPGDYVLFPGYSGQNLRIEDEGVLIIMRETDVIAKIEGTDVNDLEIPGLYFKGADGVYFGATQEFATDLIAKALQDAPWRQSMKTKNMLEHRKG